MSRPQIQQYQPGMQTPGTVVNGGLIDFQDNMQRGMPDYTITPSVIAAQQQQAASHALLQQQALQAGSAGLVQGQPQAVVAGIPPSGAVPPNWICGPASYYHVNGVTYAPVASGDPGGGGVKAPPSAVVQVAPAAVQTPPVSSSDETVEDPRKRVRRQVQAYMTNKRNENSPRGETASHGKTPASVASSNGSNTRRQKAQPSPEEAAAMRVNSLNASMPIVSNTNGHIQVRRKW